MSKLKIDAPRMWADTHTESIYDGLRGGRKSWPGLQGYVRVVREADWRWIMAVLRAVDAALPMKREAAMDALRTRSAKRRKA